MIPARISIVTIGARDVIALGAFYRRLGWTEVMKADDGFTAYETAGAILTLYPLNSLASDANVEPARDQGFRGITLAINVEGPDDVDRSIEDARDAGADILTEPETATWGGRSAYFADPEGNVWEVAWMPGSSFDERGGLILPRDS